MLDSIINKGIPFGILMAFAAVAVDVYFQGALEYHFSVLKFFLISTVGGIAIGWLRYKLAGSQKK